MGKTVEEICSQGGAKKEGEKEKDGEGGSNRAGEVYAAQAQQLPRLRQWM